MAKKFITNNIGLMNELRKYYKDDDVILVDVNVYHKDNEISKETENFSLMNYPFSYYENFKINKNKNLDIQAISNIEPKDIIVCAFSSDIFGMLAFAKLMEESGVNIKNTITLDTKWYYKKVPVVDMNFYPTEWYLGLRMGQYLSTMSRVEFGSKED